MTQYSIVLALFLGTIDSTKLSERSNGASTNKNPNLSQTMTRTYNYKGGDSDIEALAQI